jgi:hypothetical protein
LSKIVAVASSGTPADGTQASANPGQTITLQGNGLSSSTNVVFHVIDGSGNVSERLVAPTTANGTQLTVVVPNDAMTGVIGIVGDGNNTQALLQIVPILISATINGGTVQLKGGGFVRGNESSYNFPGDVLIDINDSSVYSVYSGFGQPDDAVNFPLPTTSVTGTLTVTTNGGTSAGIPWNPPAGP